MQELYQKINIAILIDRLMRQIHGGLHAQASEFDTENVGPGGGMILMTLSDVEPAPVQLIAKLMARDKSQMTRAIQNLERKGLVSRSSDASDARISLLRLTGKGRGVVSRIQHALASVVDEILSSLDATEKAQLEDLLSKLGPDYTRSKQQASGR